MITISGPVARNRGPHREQALADIPASCLCRWRWHEDKARYTWAAWAYGCVWHGWR